MDLEQRVKTLEQEVAILKGQIQTTLLNIQEQLLSNTYPALRADETPRAEPVARYLEHDDSEPLSSISLIEPDPQPAISAYSVSQPPASSVHTIRLPQEKSEMAGCEPDAVSPPPVKQVFLESLSDLHDDDTLSIRVPTPPAADLDWDTFNRLAEWTADSIEEIGIERTIGLVKIYSHRGVFSDEARDVLVQAVNLYGFYETNGALDLEFENLTEDARQEMTPRERRRSLIVRLVEGLQNMSAGQEQSYG